MGCGSSKVSAPASATSASGETRFLWHEVHPNPPDANCDSLQKTETDVTPYRTTTIVTEATPSDGVVVEKMPTPQAGEKGEESTREMAEGMDALKNQVKAITVKSFMSVPFFQKIAELGEYLPSVTCTGVPLIQRKEKHTYIVEAFTSAQLGAGSDATLKLAIIGENGQVACTLNNTWFRRGRLRRGECLTMSVDTEESLGEIGAVVVYFDACDTTGEKLLHRLIDATDLASLVRDPATTLDLDHAWGVDEIVIFEGSAGDDGSMWSFQLHRWMSVRDGANVAVAFSQAAHLTQHTPAYLRVARKTDLETVCHLKWTLPYDGMLPCVCQQPLPIAEAFTDAKAEDFAMNTLATGRALKAIEKMHEQNCFAPSFPDLKSYQVLYSDEHHIPWCSKNDLWRRDDIWGASFLVGPNAGTRYLRNITALPIELANVINDDALRGGMSDGPPHPYLGQDTTLAVELAHGRIYLADFADLQGMTLSPELSQTFEDSYVAQRAMCLLRACPSTSKKPFALLPLCIVLQPERGADAPVFLPQDPEYEWLNARCHVGAASANCQEVGTHFLYCHGAAEAVCVATNNQLSYCHPMRRLLQPHVEFTPAINAAARASLINAGGVIESTFALGPHSIIFDQACADAWNSRLPTPVEPDGVSFAASMWQKWEGFTHLPRRLAKYGLDSANLEMFPFRDDALLIWNAQWDWVKANVDAYYHSDVDIAADAELSAFVQEMIAALGKAPFAPIDEYANAAKNRKALIDFLTSFIFTVTCMHAATNYCQYENYAFAPFMPTSMRKPPPSAKNQCTTERDFLDALPTAHKTAIISSITYTLSSKADEHYALSNSCVQWVSDPILGRARDQYNSALQATSAAIQARNTDAKSRGLNHFDYSYLDPKSLPKSVAI